MKTGMTSTKDFHPTTLKLLEDGQWHGAGELLEAVGKEIMPEQAYRFYRASSKQRLDQQNDDKPYDEQVRAGRRRGVYVCLKHLTDRGYVCQRPEGKIEFEAREFKLTGKKMEPRKPKKEVVLDVQPSADAKQCDILALNPLEQARQHLDAEFKTVEEAMRRFKKSLGKLHELIVEANSHEEVKP
jgi:hypothetical protein